MTIEEILKLPVPDIIKEVCQKEKFKISQDEAIKMFDVKKHDIFDPKKRKDKDIIVDTGIKDFFTGENVTRTKTEPVTRIGMPYEKIIAKRRAGFMLGNRLNFKTNIRDKNKEKDMQTVFDMQQAIWKDCKLDYVNKEMAITLFSEMEVAEIWYYIERPGFWNWLKKVSGLGNIQYTIRHRVLKYSNGDIMYPHKNEYGDMDAFGWKYKKEIDNKEVEFFTLFTDNYTYTYINQNGWAEYSKNPNAQLGKIQAIYWRIEEPIYNDIESMRESQEQSFSDIVDENRYTGSPITKVWGNIEGFVEKGERGKMLQFTGKKEENDAEYLTNNNAPASIEMELDRKDSKIYEFTQTPNISFEQMKSIGATTGIALKLLFLDAHMAAELDWGVFGEGVQRRCNLQKAMIGRVLAPKLRQAAEDLDITPIMTPYMPVDTESTITTLMRANGEKPIISQRRSVELNPLIEDADMEMELIKQDEEKTIQNTRLQTEFFPEIPDEDDDDPTDSVN